MKKMKTKLKNGKLLYSFSGVAGLFFPTGKDATCEFASDKCLAACTAVKHERLQITQNIKDRIPIEELKEIYQFFQKNRAFVITGYLLKNLQEFNTNILHWFASGDCKDSDMKKILWIMEMLSDQGIVQCGFTRNRELWEEVNKLKEKDKNFPYGIGKHNIILALTVEEKPEAKKLSTKSLVSVPNFKTGNFELYKNGQKHIGCGIFADPKLQKIKRVTHDCQDCYNKKKGCFTLIKHGVLSTEEL